MLYKIKSLELKNKNQTIELPRDAIGITLIQLPARKLRRRIVYPYRLVWLEPLPPERIDPVKNLEKIREEFKRQEAGG